MTRFSLPVTLFCVLAASLLSVSWAYGPCSEPGHYLRYYPGDCSRYYECVHGRAINQSCGWFHRFDETVNKCKLYIPGVSKVNCSMALREPPRTLLLQAEPSFNSAHGQQICTQDKVYNRYYPGDCDKYYSCNHGTATEKSCGWFHRFDEKSGECRVYVLFIGSVDCSQALHPTTAPPTVSTTPGTSKTTSGPTTKPGPTVSSTSSTSSTTPQPNSHSTKKHSGAGSTEVSVFLASICAIFAITTQFH